MRIYTYPDTPQHHEKRNSIILIGLITLVCFSYVLFSKSHNSLVFFISPLGDASTVLASFSEITKAKAETPSELPSIIAELPDAATSYGIVIKNIKTGEKYKLNENKSFEPASLYKLWIMATTYSQIEDGTLTEDEVLSDSIANLNARFGIDPENAELTDGGISLSVKQAIHQMITISHNYAAMLLSVKIRYKNVNTYLQSHGLLSSRVNTDGTSPETTANDIALFFEKLYNGELANEEHTQAMIDTLKAQQINHKLPKLLPKDTEIAHKTGELYGYSHDAGIVYTPKGDYIIAVLSNTDTPSSAESDMANVSKKVYDYILNK